MTRFITPRNSLRDVLSKPIEAKHLTRLLAGVLIVPVIAMMLVTGPAKADPGDESQAAGDASMQTDGESEGASAGTKPRGDGRAALRLMSETRNTLAALDTTNMTLVTSSDTHTYLHILDELRNQSGLQFVMSTEDMDPETTAPDLQLTASVRDVLDALSAVTQEFHWAVSGNIIYIGAGAINRMKQISLSYDVVDILAELAGRHNVLIERITRRQAEIRKIGSGEGLEYDDREYVLDNAETVAETLSDYISSVVENAISDYESELKRGSSAGVISLRGSCMAHLEAQDALADLRREVMANPHDANANKAESNKKEPAAGERRGGK